MSKLILNPEFNLYERKGKAFCTSRQLAETFDKRHADVLRAIYEKHESANVIFREELDDLATQFCTANFTEIRFKDRGKFYPEVLMTKNGFSYVAMGFTGSKAERFKIQYINRFDAMERHIKSLLGAKLEFPAFTKAIMGAHEEPKHYHFSNEINMINRIVLGMSSKQFKEMHNITDVSSIRPYLETDQIGAIEELQRIDIGLILSISEFEKRKYFLSEHFSNQMRLKIGA